MTLKEVRKALGWSQRRLAIALDCDVGTISRWERELHKPSKELTERIAEFLEKPVVSGGRVPDA